LDYSLVSNKNLRQKIPSGGWRPGPGNLNQNGLKQCFSNFFILLPHFHSRHVIFTPKPDRANTR